MVYGSTQAAQAQATAIVETTPSNKQTINQRAIRFIELVIALSDEVQRLGAFFDVVRLVCVDDRFGDPVKT